MATVSALTGYDVATQPTRVVDMCNPQKYDNRLALQWLLRYHVGISRTVIGQLGLLVVSSVNDVFIYVSL